MADFPIVEHINLAITTLDELDQLAQACDPASFGAKEKEVLDEAYRKAEKMDTLCFFSPLQSVQSNLMKIIHGSLLEGTQSTKAIVAELRKLNVYGTYAFNHHFSRPTSSRLSL